jgi:phosphonate transport system permease protein
VNRSVAAGLDPARLAALERGYARAIREKRTRSALLGTALAVAIGLSAIVGEVDVPKLVDNLPRLGAYFFELVPPLGHKTLPADIADWFWGFRKWLSLLLDTVLIAYLGTLFGALGGFCLCFAASANLVKRAWLRILARRVLEVARTVPEIVYALIFVVAFGLGPLPGMMAIAIHTLGALGKLFAEANENLDLKPFEAATAVGATWIQAIRYAILPQVLPNYASYTLLRFEINVRSAAVLGFVGAGGIGHDLLTSIRSFYYLDVSAILIMILATVAAIDVGTERIRHRLIGLERTR